MRKKLSVVEMATISFYNNAGNRRYQETADARMIRESDTAVANLPREFINREFSAWKYVEKLGSAYKDNGIDFE